MLPVLWMRVNLNSDGNGNYAIQNVVYKALSAKWNCGSISSYDVEDTTTKKRVAIKNLRLEGAPPVCTTAGGMLYKQPAVVLVLNSSGIGKTDKLTVALANLPAAGTASPSAAVSLSDAALAKVPSVVPYALTITPQAAPAELLTSGLKRDTGQLAISFTAPAIAPSFHGAAVFVSSTDLFSTNELDTKSAFAASIGLKRGLATSRYIPGSIQETIQGNQVATNLSAVNGRWFVAGVDRLDEARVV